jgi:uncharacterized protein involved in type VI secretion and phage assembly
MSDDLLARLTQRVEGRFYGKYRALVVDNADPENRGRLRLQIPGVLGHEVVSGWALPCLPYGGAADQGFFFIPEVNACVWAEFEMGDLAYPIWVGAFWSKPGGETEVPKPAGAQSPPTRKIIKTLKGSSIEIEDQDGEEVLIIQYSDGSQKNIVTMDKTGVKIEDANSNKITLDTNGILVEDQHGNVMTMDASSGGLPGTNGVKINGEKKVCLEGLITWLMSHTHIGNLGAPCPLNPVDLAKLTPLTSMPDGDILSKGVKLG